MSPAILSGAVLAAALVMFAWGKARHDFVAVAALGACLLLGLVKPGEAFSGFANPAVVVVAAVLVLGRAVELTGVAAAATEKLARLKAPFALQLAILLLMAAVMSAFMNNVAALAITMPAVAGVCQAARKPVGAGLMPLAFATILGGMTTLVGTPANLLLSAVREQETGAPFQLFDVSPVGGVTALAGLAFLCLFGWRMMPKRRSGKAEVIKRYAVFELQHPVAQLTPPTLRRISTALRPARARVLGIVRDGERRAPDPALLLQQDDRLIVLARDGPWATAKSAGFGLRPLLPAVRGGVTVHAVVAHGSPLIGRPYASVAAETADEVQVAGAGPRAARAKAPLNTLVLEAGDQLLLHGVETQIQNFARYTRLVEVERRAVVSVSYWRAGFVLAVYAAAVGASVTFGLSTALTFFAAAALLPALGLMPKQAVYSAVDWPAVVLLAAMIPVGRSFETSGAAAVLASGLGDALTGTSLFVAAAVMTTATLLLSTFLNNVATAIVVGPVAVAVAQTLHVPPDAMLLAVLVGASSAFMTPIGHQNNLLVMEPGGYKFGDYVRAGALLSVVVVLASAAIITRRYG